VMEYINTPCALRKILIDELPRRPLTREISATFWDIKEGKPENKAHRVFNSPVTSLATLPDGRVVSSYENNIVKIWNIATGTCLPLSVGISKARLTVLPNGQL